MSEVGERMKGGAVMDERSPETVVILCTSRASAPQAWVLEGLGSAHDFKNDAHPLRCAAGTAWVVIHCTGSIMGRGREGEGEGVMLIYVIHTATLRMML